MRMEKDSLGELPVPDNAYYGIQTVRCAANYDVTDHTFNELPHVIRAMAEIKKACAVTNKEIGALDSDKADAIAQACDEVIAGKFPDQFPVNVWRSHGTGVNMNINEVLANRANEILTGHKGYDAVHPNTHVNMCQSSNDTYPTCEAIVLYRMIGSTLEAVKYMEEALAAKAIQFKDDVRLGRTCMQDAVPMTFGQVFGGWHCMMRRNRMRLEKLRPEYQEAVLGATVLGTGMGELPGYNELVYKNLSKIVGFEMHQAKMDGEVIEDSALFDGSANNDGLMFLLSVLKAIACAGGRIGNDLYVFSSGPRTGIGEFILPSIAPGSSIMPGKVNPVIPEVVSQVAFNIIGNDVTVTMAAEAGQLELNAFEPIIFYNLIQSVETLTYAVHTFVDNCVTGITANRERCRDMVEHSVGIITALCPHVGYEKAAEVAKRAIETGAPVRRLILEEGLLDEAALDKILDPYSMTEPGISGKELLEG